MSSPPDYDLRLALSALRRWWWVVLVVPLLALTIQVVRIRTAPYRAEFRAVVVLPGDTDDPGRSERPELMVMDDVPQLVESALFAERVRTRLEADGITIDAGAISDALASSRYARTVTVVARDDERSRAVEVATASQAAFPAAVVDTLVSDTDPPATITVIDPVDGARRGEPDQWRVAGIVTVAMSFVGVLAALALDGLRRPEPVRT